MAAACRYWLLAALVVMLLAAPLVRADDDEPSALDQYKTLATEYVNKAVELGSPYLEQAQEAATVYYKKANEILADTLDKWGVAKKDKTEL